MNVFEKPLVLLVLTGSQTVPYSEQLLITNFLYQFPLHSVFLICYSLKAVINIKTLQHKSVFLQNQQNKTIMESTISSLFFLNSLLSLQISSSLFPGQSHLFILCFYIYTLSCIYTDIPF